MEQQTVSTYLKLMPWWQVRFHLPFIILPGPDNPVILGQVMLREDLGLDAIQVMNQSVLQPREAAWLGGEDGDDNVGVVIGS